MSVNYNKNSPSIKTRYAKLHQKENKNYTPETLSLTSQLLSINPEFYTIWNYRRQILTEGIFPLKSATEVNDLITADLNLTMSALRQNPKVYWVWNHRRWCLEHVPENPGEDQSNWRKMSWVKELRVIESFLDADPRNFHAWNYRRYVLQSPYVDHTWEQELNYTTRKIESNFSNFSAWHQRSKVYTSLWERGINDEELKSIKNQEFNLIKQAIYTDPGDQSIWLYHRWLVGEGKDEELLRREIEMIEELLSIEPDRCLDTLIHYKTLLLRHRYSLKDRDECITLSSRLRQLDPFRDGRYQDIANELLSMPNN
ncbi:hypothetical protein Clacol_006521 [Clathrus columnatus]|uniref:Geranylgeranyl transferase type-2 subunit alpha n=1 Tax=Clathrus columnatus TaxID=1419009 RepID=A0AAV5AJZ6_9AGAM|nr:hypothetical protein Clacol_006521 [Clathrus columnatus]